MAAKLPIMLKPGMRVEYGLASVSLDENGRLEACDPYNCTSIRIPLVTEVYLKPVPALARPGVLVDCLYIEFTEPIAYSGERLELWFLAPFEIAVEYKKRIIVRATPTKVKYTVVGDVSDGSLCRYHKSIVAFTLSQVIDHAQPGLGLVRADITGTPTTIPGLGFYAVDTPLYSDARGIIYYPRIDSKSIGTVLENMLTVDPPLHGLETVLEGARLLTYIPFIQSLQ